MLRYLLLLIVTLALLTACGSALPPPAPGMQRLQQQAGELKVTLDLATEPRVNEAQLLRVALSDGRAQPIEGAEVWFDLDMDMLCLGGGRPMAEARGPGIYETTSAFVMPGEWRITVYARASGALHEARFTVQVAE